jgi:hypothetical protein
MAIYKIFPTKDTTIYSGYPDMNTGLDEMLETSTNFKISPSETIGSSPQASRFLIQFSQNDVNNVLNNKISGSAWRSYLKLFSAKAQGLGTSTTILANAVAEDWNMGLGYYINNPEIVNGASWKFRSYSGSNAWTTSSFAAGTTGSYNIITNPNSQGGGVWYTGSQVSQSFEYYNSLDINMDVTNIIHRWNSGSFQNYGFIVRQSETQEFIDDINQQVELKYFSLDTHTIYPPQLEFRWDDYSFSTGSSTNTILQDSDCFISIYNNNQLYYPESIAKFRVAAIPKYPSRQFTTSSLYTKNYYLPGNVSLYAIKDSETNEYVVDFDSSFTKISADETSSYFTIYMDGLQPERYYTILIQTVIDGNTIVLNENITFKVVNG